MLLNDGNCYKREKCIIRLSARNGMKVKKKIWKEYKCDSASVALPLEIPSQFSALYTYT